MKATRIVTAPALGLGATLLAAAAVPASAAPIPVAPGSLAGETLRVGACPSFHWAGVDGAESYEIAVWAADRGADGLAEPALRTTVPGRATSWAPSRDHCLEAGRRYAWSVRAAGMGADGAWSAAALFEVSAAPSAAAVEAALAVLRQHHEARPPERREGATATAPNRDREPRPGRARAPRRRAERRPTGTSSAAPSPATRTAPILSDTPSLAVDGQIHFGNRSAVFKLGLSWLWDDGWNLALGREALSRVGQQGVFNTAVGYLALFRNFSGGNNSAFGDAALRFNSAGSSNSAFGRNALEENLGSYNSAFGHNALRFSITGESNSAFGFGALESNELGSYNSAFGSGALEATRASYNSAFGYDAMAANTTGSENTAFGHRTLESNTTSSFNTAVGQAAMRDHQTGDGNTAVGEDALKHGTTGSNNIAIGRQAAFNLNGASDNIVIGDLGDGIEADKPEIRIGTQGTQVRTRIAGIAGIELTSGANVVVESDGRLGISASSRRFKEDVRAMGDVSERLARLRPVRFRYDSERSGAADRRLHYGLIAEEVAEVLPELVALDAAGQPLAVRYDLLSSLLLRELQEQRQELDRLRQEQGRLREPGSR